MKSNYRVTIGLFAWMSLGMPALVSAHPGIYMVNAKIARAIETQVITVNGAAGTFKPSASASTIPYNATAAQVRDALFADPAIGYDNITVTGNPGGPYTLKFQGALAGVNVAQVVPDARGLISIGGGLATAIAQTTLEGGADVNYPANADTMAQQDQAAVANDGYAFGIRETNGVATGGMVNYKMLPTAYRSTMTKEQIVNYPQAKTSYQVHATCQGVAALSNLTNIFAWQNDPFFVYIPWQKTSANVGGDADPQRWIDVVRNVTGVNLAALNTVAELTTACTGLGGRYTPADTVSNITAAAVADAVAAATAPLTAQVNALKAQVDTLTKTNSALNAQVQDLTKQLNDLLMMGGGDGNDERVKLLVDQIRVLLKMITKLTS